jgi:hypothetical protein
MQSEFMQGGGNMRLSLDEVLWSIFTVAMLFIVGFGVTTAIKQNHAHQRFLEEHGCQLLTEAPTGRTVYCGKGCNRPEKVYVYECLDGTKTEVR